MSIVVASFYFKYIGTDWRGLMYFVCPCSICSVMVISFFPESPLFLYEQKRIPEALAIIDKIAFLNGKE